MSSFASVQENGHSPIRVAIAGGGICGSLLASRLGCDSRFDVRVYEKGSKDALPPGLNVLIGHNAMAALGDMEPELEKALRRRGCDIQAWKARMMTGEVLYDIPDVIAEGLADRPGVMARWDQVASTMINANKDLSIFSWNTTVKNFEYKSDGTLTLTLHDNENGSIRNEDNIDLLIACDGRFSDIRKVINGGQAPKPSFGPPSIADFRLVVPDTIGFPQTLERVYNIPDRSIVQLKQYNHLSADSDFMSTCMNGIVRVGVGPIQPSISSENDTRKMIGIFGNICMPHGGVPIPEAAKTSQGLRALFTPPGGEEALDELGRFILEAVSEGAETIHWNRKQEVHACYRDSAGKVLMIGDSAGGFYPSLAQGATLAIEDACAAAGVLSAFSSSAPSSWDIPALTKLIQEMREPRRSMAASMSRSHAEHVAANGMASLHAETADWLGAEGGRKQCGEWRADLTKLWSGWPRQNDCATQAKRLAALGGQQRHFSTRPKQVRALSEQRRHCATEAARVAALDLTEPVRPDGVLPIATATPENFAPFGQVCGPTEDGIDFCDSDAQLNGFGNGIPRLYLMRLHGPRPLRFNRITHHKLVTQCLGLVSGDDDFYLAVHAPTPEGVPPSMDGLRAFRVAPNTFVLLLCGTWHAGPLWGEAPEKLFYNLELHDTNISDHNSVVLDHPATKDGFIELVNP